MDAGGGMAIASDSSEPASRAWDECQGYPDRFRGLPVTLILSLETAIMGLDAVALGGDNLLHSQRNLWLDTDISTPDTAPRRHTIGAGLCPPEQRLFPQGPVSSVAQQQRL